MQMSKVVPVDDGKTAEIYVSALDERVDEFINNLDDPEEIRKPHTFMAMLKTLYVDIFRPSAPTVHNSNSVLVTESAEVISRLWDWFVVLCLRCGSTPTVLRFSTLCGIDRNTITRWRDGTYREATPEYRGTAQKILTDAESALEMKAVEQNGIGAIFGLKSCFQWRETSPIQPELPRTERHASLAEIRERHKDATLPEPVDFSDVDFDDED